MTPIFFLLIVCPPRRENLQETFCPLREKHGKLETEQGMLMVKGTDLHVNRLSLEKGEVDLSGNIDSIAYSDVHAEQKQGENLFARLFR